MYLYFLAFLVFIAPILCICNDHFYLMLSYIGFINWFYWVWMHFFSVCQIIIIIVITNLQHKQRLKPDSSQASPQWPVAQIVD